MDLTDKGLDAVQEIGECLFSYLGMLKKVAVEQWIFDEMRKLRNIQFKFGEDRGPFDLASAIALSLQTKADAPSEALAGDRLLYEYDPAAIKAILDLITLDSV